MSYTHRILARADQPKGEATELDWINSEVRLLGKSFGKASRDIQTDIDTGRMIIVRTETTDE
jgi:hypothetical protein